LLHSRHRRPFAAIFALAFAAFAALPVGGCHAEPGARDGSGDGDRGGSDIVVIDATGHEVRLGGPAGRVISLIPSLTDWIIALGEAERLVARTDYDTDPAIAHLPSVGGGLDPSVEWLASRRPELVLAWPDAPNRSMVARLGSVGIPVYTAPIQTIEQALSAASDLGRLLDADPAAARAIARVQNGLDRVTSQAPVGPAPSVLLLIGLAPITAAGSGTFLDQLLVAAGGRNAIADVPVAWPNLSLEEVVRRAPDVVIVAGSAADGSDHDHARALAARPGWRDVPAVRQGRVHAVDPDVVHRPGPRLHESAALLARLIHGGEPR
jgi:iron complex transport system substrate-binding protein